MNIKSVCLTTMFLTCVCIIGSLPLSAHADLADCKVLRNDAKRMQECLDQNDKNRHKRANAVTMSKGQVLYRLVRDRDQYKSEMRGRDDVLHFGTKNPVNHGLVNAKQGLGMQHRSISGYYTIQLTRSTDLPRSGIAGGFSGWHEYLVRHQVFAESRHSDFIPLSK